MHANLARPNQDQNEKPLQRLHLQKNHFLVRMAHKNVLAIKLQTETLSLHFSSFLTCLVFSPQVIEPNAATLSVHSSVCPSRHSGLVLLSIEFSGCDCSCCHFHSFHLGQVLPLFGLFLVVFWRLISSLRLVLLVWVKFIPSWLSHLQLGRIHPLVHCAGTPGCQLTRQACPFCMFNRWVATPSSNKKCKWFHQPLWSVLEF